MLIELDHHRSGKHGRYGPAAMIQSRVMDLGSIGIVGFGRFGQFAAKHLRLRLDVMVSDVRDMRKQAASTGVAWGSIAETASRPFVLLAVPISEMRTCLDSVAPHLEEGALLMDCCSVKVLPVRWMLERAPEGVEVIGLHPLFGPVSAGGGVAGLPVVVCPARGGDGGLLARFFEESGLVVHVTSPEEHDRAMAESQVLAHYIGRGLLRSGFGEPSLRTPSFERLHRMMAMVRDDTPQLFADMNQYNPFAAEARRRLLQSLLQIHRELELLPPES